MSKHFEVPTQVVFTFHNGKRYERCAGIAYHDEIICGCCGGTFDMTDEFNEIEIEQELPWVSLIEEIAPLMKPMVRLKRCMKVIMKGKRRKSNGLLG